MHISSLTPSISLTFFFAQDCPASPPHNAQAILPALGKPSSPISKPSAFLSTSCLAKKLFILLIVSNDRLSPFLMFVALATATCVPPLPYSLRHSKPFSASSIIPFVGLVSMSCKSLNSCFKLSASISSFVTPSFS